MSSTLSIRFGLSSEATTEGVFGFKFVDADGDDDMDVVMASDTDLTGFGHGMA